MPTLRLPVTLSDPDKLVITGDLSAAITALEEAKEAKKVAMSGHSKAIKNVEARVHELNVSLITGTIEREIDVEDIEDIETGLVKTKRLDTNEIFKTRPMDPSERQVKLKIAGKSFDEIQAMIGDLNKTEEQVVASTPEEAEELRNQRLLQEQRDRDAEPPMMPKVGDEIEVLPTGDTEWVRVKVTEERENGFSALVGGHELIYDEVNYGDSWRHTPSWSDIVEASAEKERLAEIERLAGEQAADAAKSPKALLKAPKGHKAKKNGAPKRISVVDQDDKPIPPAEPALPEIGCFEDCTEEHEHREPRVAF